MVMTTDTLVDILKEIDQQLGERSFFTPRDLQKTGLFGSAQAVRIAIKDGRISYLKISPRRFIIPRSALITYLIHVKP